MGEGVVHEEVGDRDLGVEDDVKGRSLDIAREGRDESSGDGGAQVDEDREDDDTEDLKH